jgi:hypothetical protein
MKKITKISHLCQINISGIKKVASTPFQDKIKSSLNQSFENSPLGVWQVNLPTKSPGARPFNIPSPVCTHKSLKTWPLREFFNVEKDIYLCFIYDPPGNSTYTHSLEENILDILEEDIFIRCRDLKKWQV